ncbi:MAG: transposase, partial [Bacteroidales bacterium]|nr:transposase [Bacteroidales bacterium]
RTECRDVARNVSTVESITKNTLMSQKSPKSGSLSVVVRGFKSAISKFARENKILFDWQTRFHDHIVRDNDELNRIADYITNNPARWNSDKFYN